MIELIDKTACFTGHRPNKLGGYDKNNPTIILLKQKLVNLVQYLIEKEKITRFITGGALGTDQIAFEVIYNLQRKKYPFIKNILVIPFAEQSAVWTEQQIKTYKKILNLADEKIYVDELEKYKVKNVPIGHYHPAKMQMRNQYMVDNSKIVIAVYDGSPGGTKNCINYAIKKKKTIYYLNPKDNFKLIIQKNN